MKIFQILASQISNWFFNGKNVFEISDSEVENRHISQKKQKIIVKVLLFLKEISLL